MRNVFIFLKSSTILVVPQVDKIKFWLTEEQVVFKMDVNIEKKNRRKEIKLLKSQDFHLKKQIRLIQVV